MMHREDRLESISLANKVADKHHNFFKNKDYDATDNTHRMIISLASLIVEIHRIMPNEDKPVTFEQVAKIQAFKDVKLWVDKCESYPTLGSD